MIFKIKAEFLARAEAVRLQNLRQAFVSRRRREFRKKWTEEQGNIKNGVNGKQSEDDDDDEDDDYDHATAMEEEKTGQAAAGVAAEDRNGGPTKSKRRKRKRKRKKKRITEVNAKRWVLGNRVSLCVDAVNEVYEEGLLVDYELRIIYLNIIINYLLSLLRFWVFLSLLLFSFFFFYIVYCCMYVCVPSCNYLSPCYPRSLYPTTHTRLMVYFFIFFHLLSKTKYNQFICPWVS